MTMPAREPVTPRLAATILLLRDDPFEVLMVKRNARQFFPSALVFPGGVVDADDWSDDWLGHLGGHEKLDAHSRALRIAALRETFEETCLLAAEGRFDQPDHASEPDFRALVQRIGAILNLDAMVPYAHWITPKPAAKRYDTHFFIARAPAGQEARCDGGETVNLEWLRPEQAIALGEAGEREVLFSTRLNLLRLAECRTVDEALAAAAARQIITVEPQVERSEAGRRVFITPDAGYPENEHFISVPG